MNKKITSLWQDYETHQFTCGYCKTKHLGKDLIHDFDASELVLPLDCPNCERRVALLNIQASAQEIELFAAQGYQTAIEHLKKPDPYYESWPDFTQTDSDDESISRMAHSIEFLADENLGQDAVQFMQMVAFGIKQATDESPYIVESPTNDAHYYQLIRGSEGEYYSELGSPEAAGQDSQQTHRELLEPLGWIMPNQDSPNYHREYAADADRYDIAADAARGWRAIYK
jgi:ribulose bisphosphate carboxylase small subunit